LYSQIRNDRKGATIYFIMSILMKLQGDISTPLRSAQYDVMKNCHSRLDRESRVFSINTFSTISNFIKK